MPSLYHSLVAESRIVPYCIAESSLTLLVLFSYPPKSPLSLFLKTGALPRCLPFLVSPTALLSSPSFRFADLLHPPLSDISPVPRIPTKYCVPPQLLREIYLLLLPSTLYPLPVTAQPTVPNTPDSLVYALLHTQPLTKCFTAIARDLKPEVSMRYIAPCQGHL